MMSHAGVIARDTPATPGEANAAVRRLSRQQLAAYVAHRSTGDDHAAAITAATTPPKPGTLPTLGKVAPGWVQQRLPL